MINDDFRCIMVHVPKCAGTFIEWHFRDYRGAHNPWTFYAQKYPQKWSAYFRFAFVRNTWDWYVSLHRYWTQCAKATWVMEHDQRQDIKNRHQRWYRSHVASFVDSVANVEMLFRSKATGKHYWRQSCFVLDGRGNVAVDRLGRMETFERDMASICLEIGAEMPDVSSRVNSFATSRHYSAWYSDEMAEGIGNFYRRDVDTFGYQFERVEPYDPALAEATLNG